LEKLRDQEIGEIRGFPRGVIAGGFAGNMRPASEVSTCGDWHGWQR
jgi:hypothetical protein